MCDLLQAKRQCDSSRNAAHHLIVADIYAGCRESRVRSDAIGHDSRSGKISLAWRRGAHTLNVVVSD